MKKKKKIIEGVTCDREDIKLMHCEFKSNRQANYFKFISVNVLLLIISLQNLEETFMHHYKMRQLNNRFSVDTIKSYNRMSQRVI